MGSRIRAPYARSAAYYDFVYHDLVDYGFHVDVLERIFRAFARGRVTSVLDLGCGTGGHAIPLARRGYAVTGLDRSPAQLAVARGNARSARVRIGFLRGDMRSFDFDGSVDAAISLGGTFGYLVDPSDIRACLASVRRSLRPGGIFVFEFMQSGGAMPAPYQAWFHKVGRGYEFIRLAESRYNPRTRLLPLEFRYFVVRGNRIVDRFRETHILRTHPVGGVRRILRENRFAFLATYEIARTRAPLRAVRPKTFHVLAIARPGAQR